FSCDVITGWKRRSRGMLLAPSDDHCQSVFTRADVGGIAHLNLAVRLSVTTCLRILLQEVDKSIFKIWQGDSILWPLWTSDARDNRVQIQFQHCAVVTLIFLRHAEHALRGEVIPHRVDLFVRSARCF